MWPFKLKPASALLWCVVLFIMLYYSAFAFVDGIHWSCCSMEMAVQHGTDLYLSIPSLLKWKLYSITNQKQHSSLGVRFFCNSRSRNFKTHNRTRNEPNFCKRTRYALTYMKNVCPFANYSLPASCLWLLQNQLVPHFHSSDASSYTNLSPWMQNILDFCPRFEVLLLKRWTKASKEPGFRS